MSNHKKYFLYQPAILLLLATCLFSCQKVINVDTRDAEIKYVVEAVVSDITGESVVKLSTTKKISETNQFPGISGAVVSVTDDAGIRTTFGEITPGVYADVSFTGMVGKTYYLEIKANSETFTARSTMPQKINLDTLFITEEVLFGETRKLANIAYQDPPGKGNCYRYVQYINGNKSKPIFVNNDDYVDGKYVDTKLWYIVEDEDDKEEEIKSGDTVEIAMLCIEPVVYKYWFGVFQSATGNTQSASPANPVTNINGGALGYFSAQTFQKLSVQVP